MRISRSLFVLKAPWKQTTTPRERRKTCVVIAAGLALGLVAAAAGYEWGRPVYLRWKSERAVKQARAALQNHDEGQARLALRVAMGAGLNRDGYVVLAEYYESVGSPAAIEARQSVLKISPHDLNARLALVSAALRFRDTKIATAALTGADAADRKDPRLQSAAAILALQTGQLALANFILDQLHAAAPQDQSIRFARADVLIHHPKPATAEAARQELAEMAAAPGPQQLPALRALLRDSIARRDAAASARWGRNLFGRTDVTLGDLLNAADGLHLPDPKQAAVLDAAVQVKIEQMAAKDAALAETYAGWLIARGRAVQAGQWLDSLDPAFARQPRFVAIRAAAAEASLEWNDLESRLLAGAWGSIPAAAVELGFAAHSLELKGDRQLALRAFSASLDVSKNSDVSLTVLRSLAQAWRWPEAVALASGAQVAAFPKDPRSYRLWVSHLRADDNTAALRDALDGWRTADPANLEARYNWALTSLLIVSPHPSAEAAQVMEKFYQSDPNNPLYITGAAFARFRLGHTKDAAALLGKLKPAALQRPERAPYAAAIFAAAGQCDDARPIERLVDSTAHLLPEERELLRQAAVQCGG